ncbi:hypothetical protein [Labilibaculum antarcticum]|uniref:Uncharacterized protein n=1 Tax=Labilibaculum antarcticum TaxID=1717717 RepID=A0A1Y1CSX8_9BACT|nr:hypothetical protein [Labilibaculum antarcticum]BAX82351.1 hypothetical protein ALGA_4060 [Labilibaculum antarcticum]
MKEQFYFNQIQGKELLVASLGIHNSDWKEISTKEFSQNKQVVHDIMIKNHYDVIPVKNKSGSFAHYVTTSSWGDYSLSNIEMKSIKFAEDGIYYLTHISDAIRLMVENKRNFYFLTNHTSVVGLLSIANLNNKYFYYWLYQNLVDLEQGLGKMLSSQLDTQQICNRIEELSSQDNDLGKWFKDTSNRYKEDQKKNSDTAITEYLYFGQLIELFHQFDLHKILGYKNGDGFKKHTSYLNKIRNTVAHPTRSLIQDHSSLIELWNGIVKMDELSKSLVRESKENMD